MSVQEGPVSVGALLRPPPSGRIVGIDLARGLAVLGMFAAHVLQSDPFDWGRPETWGDIVNGRSSILFAVLAGLSVALLSGGAQPRDGLPLLQARMRILVRAVIIFALGGILSALGTGIAVILEFYAVSFAIALPLLRWRARRLFVAAGIAAVLAPLIHLLLSDLWFEAELGYSAIVDFVLLGPYPVLIWVSFLFLGMGLGRLPLRERAIQLRMLAAGVALAVLGYGAAALLAPWSSPYPRGSFDVAVLLTAEPHSGSPFEVLGSGGFALAVIALCLLAPRLLQRILYPVAATGAMALTAYTVHILLFGVFAEQIMTEPLPVYLWFAGGTLLGCALWTWGLGRGPLELMLGEVSRRAADPSSSPAPDVQEPPR